MKGWAVAVASALLLSACTTGGGDAAPSTTELEPAPSASAASTASSTASVEALALPQVGECWAYDNINRWVIEENPTASQVDCSKPHQGQTVWVGSFPDTTTVNPFTEMMTIIKPYRDENGDVDWSKVPADVHKAYDIPFASLKSAFEECDASIAKLVGTTGVAGIKQVSLFTSDATGPTDADWANGARWIRCNAVSRVPVSGNARPAALMQLPPTLDNVLATNAGTRFRYCWRSQGETVYRAICGSKRSQNMWMTLTSTLPQPSNIKYISQAQAASMARSVCLSAASRIQPQRTDADIAKNLNAWGYTKLANGSIKQGFSKKTWGKPNAFIGCAVAARDFRIV